MNATGVEHQSSSTTDHNPPWLWPRAAYVHIPFCAHKCGYCDFASLAGADHLSERYLDALEREMRMTLVEPRPVDTIFIGGGTPTRLDARALGRLTAMVRHWLPLNAGGEWTIEANPGTLDDEKADVMTEAGVNRVSLGAQSFQPRLLAALERNHAPEEVGKAVEIVRSRFPFWSLDLIFGVPGSTLDDWKADLEATLDLAPSHLSCYGLVYEKGTNLWKQREKGDVAPVEEEIERQMYEHVMDRLESFGLMLYEISNYARPGHESRHNLVYWANDAYYGLGLGAAQFLDGVRTVNTREMSAYLKRIEAGVSATGPNEKLEPEERAHESAMLMLRRTIIGIDRDDFRIRTGFDLDTLIGPVITRFVREALLEDDGRRIRLTREGRFLADRVLCEVV